MNDVYLLLTPLLVLPIVALLGFVGCDKVFGLQEIPPRPTPPTNLVAVPGDGRVDLSWDAYAGAIDYFVYRGVVSGERTDKFLVTAPTTTYADVNVVNGTTYFYVVTVRTAGDESDFSDEKPATPIATTADFVTAFTVGTPRNTFTGWAGMEFTVASKALDVHALGRVYAAGNIRQHAIKIIRKIGLTDVAAVTLDTTGGTDGQMQSTPLTSPATLSPNTTYYIVSQEMAGQDFFFQDNSTIQTTGAANVVNAISGDGVTFLQGATGYRCFGPLNFRYSVTP